MSTGAGKPPHDCTVDDDGYCDECGEVWPDGVTVIYDEVAGFTEADFERVKEMKRDRR